MARLDNQHRITIPLDIWNMVEANYPTRSLAFCIENNRLLLLDTQATDLYSKKVMLRNIVIDSKHRVTISSDITQYLGIQSFVILYTQKGLLYLEAPPNHSTKKD